MRRRKMPWGWMGGWTHSKRTKLYGNSKCSCFSELLPTPTTFKLQSFQIELTSTLCHLKKNPQNDTTNPISSATTTRWTDFSESSSTAASGVFFGNLGGECRTLIRVKSIPSLRPLMPFPKLLQQTLLAQPPLLLLWMQMCAEWEGRLLLRFREEDWESTIWVMCKWASE